MRHAIFHIHPDHVNVVYEETGKQTSSVTFELGDQVDEHIKTLVKSNWNIKSTYHNN